MFRSVEAALGSDGAFTVQDKARPVVLGVSFVFFGRAPAFVHLSIALARRPFYACTSSLDGAGSSELCIQDLHSWHWCGG